jgi:serine/threonine protein kinase
MLPRKNSCSQAQGNLDPGYLPSDETLKKRGVSITEEKGKVYGCHGDLKLQNVLWFRDGPDDRGILKITDFGLGSFNSKKSRSMEPLKNIARSPSYRAPEYDLEDGKATRACDVWSLGCIFLEFVTWLLGGKQLLEEFGKARLSVSNFPVMLCSDKFFDIETDENGQHKAVVKKSVGEVSNYNAISPAASFDAPG